MRRSAAARIALVAPLLLGGCFAGDDPVEPGGPSGTVTPADGDLSIDAVDVGGYELYLQCVGTGDPTVVLEAGYGASGTSTWFQFQEQSAGLARMCTYDRAGIGLSDRRPNSAELTVALMAEELHTLLERAGEEPPFVLIGHSFGGFVVQHFALAYPEEVAGVVLEESNQVDEIPAYRLEHAGAWIEADQRIDIGVTEDRLSGLDLGDMPLVVITAAVYEDVLDEDLFFSLQDRLAELSSTSVHVLAERSGHFVHDFNPPLVTQAVGSVVEAVRGDGSLPPCEDVYPELGGECLAG